MVQQEAGKKFRVTRYSGYSDRNKSSDIIIFFFFHIFPAAFRCKLCFNCLHLQHDEQAFPTEILPDHRHVATARTRRRPLETHAVEPFSQGLHGCAAVHRARTCGLCHATFIQYDTRHRSHFCDDFRHRARVRTLRIH